MHIHSYTKPLFGKTIERSIQDEEPYHTERELREKNEEVYRYALQLQKIANMFDPNSELSRLNAKRTAVVSSELLFLIQEGLRWSSYTEGAYDISLGRQILARKHHLPVPKVHCSYRDIVCEGNKIILMHPDVRVDLGSIAKGFIGDKVVEYLNDKGWTSGLVDARGDIRVFGDFKEEIAIQHPRDPDSEIGYMIIEQGAVATSGDYMQYDTTYSMSHILHQRMYSSVSVIASTLTEADVLATVLFVADESLEERLRHDVPSLNYIAVRNDGRVEQRPSDKKLLYT